MIQHGQLLRNWRARMAAGTKKSTILLAFAITAVIGGLPIQATPVTHGISAANISVQQNDTGNTAASVTLTTPVEINDFRVVNGTLTSRADYFVQIGASATDDVTGGILISSITDNGRDNGEGNGINWGTSGIDSNASTSPGSSGQYWIPVFGTVDDTNYPEYNFDVAGAYFPYSNGWYGGWIVSTTGANNGVSATISSDTLWSNPNMVLGTDVIPLGAGKVTVNLLRFGLDSRSNAILLCCGGKNEENFADSQTNADGTWTVTCRDDASGSGEGDPVAFVAVPLTNHLVVSGRFYGDTSIGMQSGPFSVSNPSAGIYHLTIPGVTPGHGVLIISGEEGGSVNGDNIVSYQATANGWDIQTRDVGAGNKIPGLQELPASDAVVSFIYIPAPTPGVTVTPTNGLATSEAGGTASFNVVLDAPPLAEVDINVASSQPNEGLPSVSTLAFLPSNWNVPQTVTVTGQNNSAANVQTYAITFSPSTSADTNYNGVQAPSVTLANVPNGQAGIFVVPTNGLITTGSGGTATFQVLLNVQPTSDVTLGFTSSNPNQGTLSTNSLTFNAANWNTPQVITITGVDDHIVNGDIAYQIISSPAVSGDPNYSGFNVGNISVVNQDNDVAGLSLNIGGSIAVTEGGHTNFTVALSAQPVTNVTVTYASTDTAHGTVSPTTLTFTAGNWNVPQTVTLNGLNDATVSGNSTYDLTTTITSANIGYSNLVVADIIATTVKAVGLPSGTAIYGLGTTAVGIDGLATVNESLDFDGATFTFALTANADPNDVLGVRNTGTGSGQIGVSGNAVSFGGAQIATFTGGAGSTPLVITVGTGIPGTEVQALIDSVTFATTTTNDFANRTLQVTLNYTGGGVSSVSKIIRVGQLRVSQFQDGADYGYGVYGGEADIEVAQAQSSTPLPAGINTANGLFVTLNTSSSDQQVLLRFDNLIGTNAGQIPPGSIIVSADLNLNIINSGDGFALNRMLISWDATNATWNSFSDQFGNTGVGVYADDFTAKAQTFSQLGNYVEGVGAGGATTFSTSAGGVGNVSFGVTPDVQAWASGETNFGWVCDAQGVLDQAGNQPWLNLTDGTGFSPSEDPVVANHPRLRVLWLPAGIASASFQYGVNGYTGASDCEILQASPNVSTPSGAEVFSDGADLGSADATESLFQFSNIIGTTSNQVPPNAHVEVAMLNLASINSSAAVGDGGQFFAVLQPWQDTTTTWNSWSTNGIQTDGVQAAVNSTASAGVPVLVPNVQGGYHSFEVTPDVQNWVNGTLPNNGWALIPWPNGADGWGVDTAESVATNSRPQLVVYYTPGTGLVVPTRPSLLPLTVSAAQVVIKFNGTIGTTYSIRRSSTVNGTYGVIGTAVVGSDGAGTYTDTAPITPGAFYRVSNP